jgi:hypothetical protein
MPTTPRYVSGRPTSTRTSRRSPRTASSLTSTTPKPSRLSTTSSPQLASAVRPGSRTPTGTPSQYSNRNSHHPVERGLSSLRLSPVRGSCQPPIGRPARIPAAGRPVVFQGRTRGMPCGHGARDRRARDRCQRPSPWECQAASAPEQLICTCARRNASAITGEYGTTDREADSETGQRSLTAPNCK